MIAGVRNHRAVRRHAMTLLEILLVSILSATLLVVLWGLFSIYVKLFEAGHAKSEQSQLARALLQQIRDDLQCAIEDSRTSDLPTTAAGSSGARASDRRFGLLGSRHSLRFDVLQAVPAEKIPPPDTQAGDRTTDLERKIIPRVPELRTIVYTFQQPVPERAQRSSDEEIALEAQQPAEDVHPGLTRQEMDFETPLQSKDEVRRENRLPRRVDGSDAPAHGVGVTGGPDNEPERVTPSVDESTTRFPEVVGLAFRYFDGSGWSEDWNSLQRKSLPVAVEVAIQVQSAEQARAASAREETPSEDEDPRRQEAAQWQREAELQEALESESTGRLRTAQEKEAPSLPIARVVIDLPGAKLHPALQAPATALLAQPVELPALPPPPLPPLDLPLPALPSERSLLRPRNADQWMRVEP